MKNPAYYLLIALAIIPLNPLQAQEKLTLEEAVMERWSTFRPESVKQLTWIPNSEDYAWQKGEEMVKSNAKSGEELPLFNLETLNSVLPKDVERLKKLPRFSWKSDNTVSFTSNDQLMHYTLGGGIKMINQFPEERANADIHSKSGNLAYTVDNNLYIKAIGEKQKAVTQLEKGIVAGQAIHRSEFGIYKGTFWSPSGDHLAFYQKDEREVSTYALMDYTATPAVTEEIRYPMAGQTGEKPRVGVFSVANGKTIYLNVENNKSDDSYYITNLTWSPDEKHIYLAIVNRDQNEMYLGRWNATSGEEEQRLFSESDEQYIEPERGPIFINKDPSTFLWFSERDGFDHLYLYTKKGALIRQVTSGDFDILDVEQASPDGKYIYVNAAGPKPTERHLFSASIAKGKMKQITKEAGVHRLQINDEGTCVIDQYSAVDVPNVQQIIGINGKLERQLLVAENPLKDKAAGNTMLFPKTTKDGTELWCRMIKPSNFDRTKEHPVLVYLYNGPHAQMVTNSWLGGAPMWMHYMAERGYIVFTVDGRGSAHRGIEFEQAIFRDLGEQEMKDQLEMVNWLKSEEYTDADRFGVHGWSYGGFMTSSLMLRHPGAFKVGVAGGPVTDWKYYEVMYGERYMDTPQTNPEGYEKTKLHNYVDNLEGDLLLIHGTSDPVVLMQHNMTLVKAFVDAGKQVDFFPYPGHPHNVRGKDRVHLMQKILDYIDTSLSK